MQKLLAIIISIALYAPPVADILAFAECSIEAMVAAKEEDCGCTIDVQHTTNHHASANLPSKQNDNDLKFLNGTNWLVQPIVYQKQLAFQQWQSPFHPALYTNCVFHPPGC